MHLAQANIAFFRWPLDDVRMRGFVAQIESINAFAEQSPGFVWRFQDSFVPQGSELPWSSDLLFFNMSVWRDFNSLMDFVGSSPHRAVMSERQTWVVQHQGVNAALWWVKENHFPTVDDAVTAITRVESTGSTEVSFTAGSPFCFVEPRS